MSDLTAFSVLALVTCLLAVALTLVMARHWPHARRRVILLASLPLPGLLGGAGLFFFARAWFTYAVQHQECGPRYSCTTDMGFSLLIIFYALLVYLIGAAAAWVTLKLKGKPPVDVSLEDVFE